MYRYFLVLSAVLANLLNTAPLGPDLPYINSRPISGLIRVDSMGDKSLQLPIRPDLSKDYPLQIASVSDVSAALDSDKDGVPDYLDSHPYQAGALLNILYNVPYNGKEYVFRLDVARDYADVYRSSQPHIINPDGSNVASFVVKDDPYIKDLVAQAKAYAAADKKVKSDELLIALAKSLAYNSDAYTGRMEYPKYPIETLLDQSGDCEDLSVLTVNLIGELKGYSEVVFVSYPDHMATAMKTSMKDIDSRKRTLLPSDYVGNTEAAYLFQETTHISWQLGQLPKEYKGKDYKLYSVL